MLLLPIVDRELRVTARSGRLYWGRVTTGVAALAMSLWCGPIFVVEAIDDGLTRVQGFESLSTVSVQFGGMAAIENQAAAMRNVC